MVDLLGELPKKISESRASICVMGLGRIGIPLAVVLARSGLRVVGVDVNKSRVDSLNRGQMPFHYPAIQEWLSAVLDAGMLKASLDSKSSIDNCDVVVVTVGTPIGNQYQVDYVQLHSALNEIASANLKDKAIILRSTSVPGTVNEIVLPLLTNRSKLRPETDFALAACPERILEGQAHRELYELPEIVGGIGVRSNAIASELFRKISPTKKIIITTPTAAELAKLFTNIHRYVNFALANEFAIWAERYGEDAHQVISNANDDYPRSKIPKPGFAGGPCLGKDGFLLDAGTPFSSIVSVAWKMNEAVPQHVASALMKEIGPLSGRKVAVLGLAFKAESDDVRLSPSAKLVEILNAYGAEVSAHDPFVNGSVPLKEALENPDAVVIATNHWAFKSLAPAINASGCRLVYDVWGMFDSHDFENSRYRRFGSTK